MYAQICILFASLCFDRTSLGVSTNCFVIVVVFVFVIVLIAHFPISFSSCVSFSLRSPCVVVASVFIVVFPSLTYLCCCAVVVVVARFAFTLV